MAKPSAKPTDVSNKKCRRSSYGPAYPAYSLAVAIATRRCNVCDQPEERVFEDSYTGTEICLDCLSQMLNDITNSPVTDGDNLPELIREMNEEE